MINQSYIEKESNALWQIREGVPVYDWDNQHVGDVKYVQFPSGLTEGESESDENLVHIPEDIREMLIREGYIQVGAGLLWPDYYIRPVQVLEVDDKQIMLNVMKAELMRF